MHHRATSAITVPIRQAKQINGVAKARTARRIPSRKRARGGQRNVHLPFAPPEDWHEPCQRSSGDYRIVVKPPGAGYRHVLAPQEIRERLAQVPPGFLRNLTVVQLSQMTRKKQGFPCYGMQWGNALYLYPLEESLVEHFYTPPHPNLVNETRMYGGRWEHDPPNAWRLVWSEKAIKDYYLNNILIHELGHLVDDRNAGYVDRERYAEWFAVHYGYLPSRRHWGEPRKAVRRHHKTAR